jgi:hypothetical protein
MPAQPVNRVSIIIKNHLACIDILLVIPLQAISLQDLFDRGASLKTLLAVKVPPGYFVPGNNFLPEIFLNIISDKTSCP